jgi:YVTN family beta-propeller protein
MQSNRLSTAVVKANSCDDAVIAKLWLGAFPRDIVTSRDGDPIYVMTADSVKAINSFHHIVGSVPIGQEPKQMVMSSDGRRIYVTGYDGILSIIDPTDMTATRPVLRPSTAIAVSPDGEYVYLAHGEMVGDCTRTWISVVRADGACVALIAFDRYPTGMALSPNGRRLYVASTGLDAGERGGSITVIDTASYRTVDVIAVDEAPESLTVDAEGLLCVTHHHSNSVSVVDPGTQCGITVALDDAPMEVVARPASEFIYTTNLHSIIATDTLTAATESLTIGKLPRRLCVSPDGQRLYATDFAHGTVWVVDTSDNSVVGAVELDVNPAEVALSPNGEFLHVTDSRHGTLTVVSTTLVKLHAGDTA